MLEINLLPQSEKEKILTQRGSSFFNSFMIPFSILIILVAGLLGYLFWSYSQQNQNLDSQIASSQSSKTKYENIINQVNEYNQVLSLSQQIFKYQTNWVNILNELATQTPGNVQITKFDYSSTTALSKKAAEISGLSDNYHDLILFKDKLDSSKEFKNTVINTATADDKDVVNFDILVGLKNIKVIPKSTQNMQNSGG
jgi:Tfp pilus assembly protein PilN